MPDFKIACSYAASQGWLNVEDDALTVITAGLAGRLNLSNPDADPPMLIG